MSGTPRISVVVPTFQRRALVVALIEALGRQEYHQPFEAIVVVDGSTDGTVAALERLVPAFPLRVIAQPNRGLARARNRGAAAAAGEILLFLDDDMEPAPGLLAEHDRSHREGAGVVSGAIPLHPDSPANLLAEGVGSWAEGLGRRRAQAGYVPRFDEIVNGHLSLRRDIFTQLGGFDERFTAAGSYGAEDLDFGYRVIAGGYRVAYNPRAIARQRYVVDAATHLRQYRQAGRADVALVRKHPELAERVFAGKCADSRIHRLVSGPVSWAQRLAGLAAAPLRALATSRVSRGCRDRLTAWLFFGARAVEYWRGVAQAGGIPRARPMRVLAYHAIADLAGDPLLERYGVPVSVFEHQLDTLQRAGYRFVEPEELSRLLEGHGGVPRRALLLTFDDCYQNLADAALPVLAARGIPAVAFAVTGHLGGTNEWDQASGARAVRLMDIAGLATLGGARIEVGAHSRTHRMLTTVPDDEIPAEITGSVEQLRSAGLGPVRFFAYPHGEHDARVRQAAHSARLRAAFTVDPGRVRAGDDPYAIRRLEIYRHDVGWKLRLKVALAGYGSDLWNRARGRARLRTRFRQLRGR